LLLDALEPKVVGCKSPLSIQEVANALYGLQGVTGAASAQSIIRFLLSQSCLNEDKSMRELIMLGQSVTLMLPFLWGTKDYDGWAQIKRSICDELSGRQTGAYPSNGGQSAAESRIQDLASKLFDGSNVQMSSNEYLCDVFESDLVIRLAYNEECGTASSSALVINIEVDGVHHEEERKKRYCRLRDAYLKSKGIIIMRMTVARLETLNDAAIEQWLLNGVADSALGSG
jgi:hypothetical protein